MGAREYQSYVYKKIPMAKAMGLKVVHRSAKQVRFSAPLAPNLNHMGTGFGGSIVGLQAICAWAWITKVFEIEGVSAQIVAKSCETHFYAAVTGKFEVVCNGIPVHEQKRVIRELKIKGKSRFMVSAQINQARKKRADFVGQFVALRGKA